VVLHGAALATVLAFGSGWWGDAQPTVGTAPAVWPVVWVDTAAMPQDAAEPTAEPAPTLTAAKEIAPEMKKPEPEKLKPGKFEPKPEVRKTKPKKPPPVAAGDIATIAATVAAGEPDTAEAPEPESASEATKSAPPAVAASAGAVTGAAELAALPPPAAAPASTGWSVEVRIPPVYPLAARRRGVEGEVVLRAEIDADGAPTAVNVIRGSGHAELDAAARAAVEKWRFQAPRGSGVEIPIVFRLENR
jgi:protein TonB